MSLLGSNDYKEISDVVSNYKRVDIISFASAMLTLPEYHANTLRLETIVHLSIMKSNGVLIPNRTIFNKLYNELFFENSLEDPVEDVFVSSICTKNGSYKLFLGLWESCDYFIQTIIDILSFDNAPLYIENIKKSSISLLILSNEIANRANLKNNHHESSIPKSKIKTPSTEFMIKIKNRVIFTQEQLIKLNVDVNSLSPFIINEDEIKGLSKENITESTLNKKPIVRIGELLIIANPSAISVAIRHYVISEFIQLGKITELDYNLNLFYTKQLIHDIFWNYDLIENKFENDRIFDTPPSDLTSLIFKDKNNNYIHTILLKDNLEEISKDGFSSFHEVPEETIQKIHHLSEKSSNHFKNNENFNSGGTMIVHGGLGRGVAIGFNKWPDEWGFYSLSLSDLLLIASSNSEAISDFVYCIFQQRWLKKQGVKISNINGDMNFYGYWDRNENNCINEDISINDNTHIFIATDYIFNIRERYRSISNIHSAIGVDGKWKRVERFNKDGYFSSMESLPIYVSTSDIKKNRLNLIIELENIDVWFGVLNVKKNSTRSLIFEWWSSFSNLLYHSLNYINNNISIIIKKRIQINMDFSLVSGINYIPLSPDTLNTEKNLNVIFKGNIATLKFEKDFLYNFLSPNNTGEKLVISAIIKSIARIIGEDRIFTNKLIEESVEHTLGNNGVRVVHAFKNHSSVDYLLHKKSKKQLLINYKYIAFEKIKLGYKRKTAKSVISTLDDCSLFFNKTVEIIWFEIKDNLKKLHRETLLIALIENINNIEQDRSQWRNTARAVDAIHGKHDNIIEIAGARESDRSLSSLSCRALIEMAMCESPTDSSNKVTDENLIKLISLCSLMINTASDGDSIHWGLIKPSVSINKNGTYKIIEDIHSTILLPYYFHHFDVNFTDAIKSYEDLYNDTSNEKNGIELPLGFNEAFSAEYNIDYNEFIECIAELIDLLMGRGSTASIFSKLELISLISKSRSIKDTTVERFITEFVLPRRTSWDKFSKGTTFRDVMPWKFKRKMSCLVKPLLDIGDDKILCSLSLIKHGFSYFIDRVTKGDFNSEFFKSRLMRSFVGSMVEKKGAEVTNSVASLFKNSGWSVKQELLMTQLGAPKELGDIDVLAINNNGLLLIIECKRLQMAKTISEIADVCSRFSGKERDELSKHLNRVEWIIKNKDTVLKNSRFKDLKNNEITRIEHYLLTSTVMPMKFIDGLPINKNNIISFTDLDELIGHL